MLVLAAAPTFICAENETIGLRDLCSDLLRDLNRDNDTSYLQLVNHVPTIVPRNSHLRDLRNRLRYDFSFVDQQDLHEMSHDLMKAIISIRKIFEEEGLPFYWHSSRNHSLADQGLSAHILAYPFSDRKLREVLYLVHAFSHPVDDAIDNHPLQSFDTYARILNVENSEILETVDLRLHFIWNRINRIAIQLLKRPDETSHFFQDHFLRGMSRTYIARGMFAHDMPIMERRELRRIYQDYLAVRADDERVQKLIQDLDPLHIALTTKVLAESYYGVIAGYFPQSIFYKIRSLSLLMELVFAPVAAINNDVYEIEDGDLNESDLLNPKRVKQNVRRVVSVIKKDFSDAQIQFIFFPLPAVLAIYGDAMRAKGIYSTYESILKDSDIGPLLEPKVIFDRQSWNRKQLTNGIRPIATSE